MTHQLDAGNERARKAEELAKIHFDDGISQQGVTKSYEQAASEALSSVDKFWPQSTRGVRLSEAAITNALDVLTEQAPVSKSPTYDRVITATSDLKYKSEQYGNFARGVYSAQDARDQMLKESDEILASDPTKSQKILEHVTLAYTQNTPELTESEADMMRYASKGGYKDMVEKNLDVDKIMDMNPKEFLFLDSAVQDLFVKELKEKVTHSNKKEDENYQKYFDKLKSLAVGEDKQLLDREVSKKALFAYSNEEKRRLKSDTDSNVAKYVTQMQKEKAYQESRPIKTHPVYISQKPQSTLQKLGSWFGGLFGR